MRIWGAMACAAVALHAVRAAAQGTPATQAAQGTIVGTVYDSLSAQSPLAGATVVLVERSKYATTDARGRFQFDSVPNGHYTLGFMHPLLDALDLQAPVVPVDVGGTRVNVRLSTPSAATAYSMMCPGAHEPATGVVIGRVRDVDDGSPVNGAAARTSWTEYTLVGGRTQGHPVGVETHTKADGAYLLCGVPTDLALDVYADAGGFIAGPVPLAAHDQLLRRVDLAVSRKDSAARDIVADASPRIAIGHRGTVTLRGALKEKGGGVVRGATLTVLGTRRTSRTDSTGAFWIDRVPAGTRTVEVRSIGASPVTFTFDLATGVVRDTTLTVDRQAQKLQAVAIKGQQNTSLMSLDGFDKRKQMGMGAFLTDEDIRKSTFADLNQVLASIRGMKVEYGTSGYPMPMLRGGAQGSCIPNFFLDGSPYAVDGPGPGGASFANLAGLVTPEAIKGIEVYNAVGTIPPQYDKTSSTGCGSIVIWTR
ncbi:MAG: carboxypeptidase regulatory-like domain-containing protein [Gemmatimonadetes bacterium]|nr:carboxypeptidase regulatory-like domain-containing protein [Gemmatimonadota bacterium]